MYYKIIANDFICTNCCFIIFNVMPPVLWLLLVSRLFTFIRLFLPYPFQQYYNFFQGLCILFHYAEGIPSAWQEFKFLRSQKSFRLMCCTLTRWILKCIGKQDKCTLHAVKCGEQTGTFDISWVANGRFCLVNPYLCFKLHMNKNHRSGRKWFPFLWRYH